MQLLIIETKKIKLSDILSFLLSINLDKRGRGASSLLAPLWLRPCVKV